MGATNRLRREPPPYLPVTVRAAEPITSWMTRITLEGPGLVEMEPAQPAASVRLLLPGPGGLILPAWNGNEFLLPDGNRPAIRTFTPRHQQADRLDIDVVLHDGGAASSWARAAEPGRPAAVSGPGRGSAPDPGSSGYLLAGDEAAVPAIAQLLGTMPPAEAIDVLIESAHCDDPVPLPERSDATIRWVPSEADIPGAALVAAVREADLPAGTRVWAAGEAAAMQQIRRHLEERQIPRRHTTVRGYWKHGKPAGARAG